MRVVIITSIVSIIFLYLGIAIPSTYIDKMYSGYEQAIEDSKVVAVIVEKYEINPQPIQEGDLTVEPTGYSEKVFLLANGIRKEVSRADFNSYSVGDKYTYFDE